MILLRFLVPVNHPSFMMYFQWSPNFTRTSRYFPHRSYSFGACSIFSDKRLSEQEGPSGTNVSGSVESVLTIVPALRHGVNRLGHHFCTRRPPVSHAEWIFPD